MKKHKQFIYFIFIVEFIFLFGITHSQANSLLTSSGQNIINAKGEIIYLKGFNLGGWLNWEGWMWSDWNNPPEHRYIDSLKKYIGEEEAIKFWKNIHENYITESDIKLIKESGFNCVRIPINYKMFYSYNNGDKINVYGFNFIEKVVSWCNTNNVYIVFDLHAVPGSQVFETFADSELDSNKLVWNNTENQKRTINVWKKIASKCKNYNIVAGYNLINEPLVSSNKILVNFYNRIISGIREQDNDHIIFLDGNGYATNFEDFEKIEDQNIVLDAHRYSDFNFIPKEPLLQNIEISKKLNKPVWLGEWGENSINVVDSMLILLKKNNFNYCGWAYWTWKRTVIENKQTPVSFETKESWKIIKSIVSDKTDKNYSREEIIGALNDFIETIKTDNCKIDTNYIKLLAK
jgi:endoglucanase